MNLSTLRPWLLAAAICLVSIAAAQAQQLSVVREGDTIIAMQGSLVASKYNEVTGESAQFIYISGLLWQAAYSDGTVSTYSYDTDGKLLRIETRKFVSDKDGKLVPTSMAGISQQAVYAGDKLIALASSNGSRLTMDPRLAQRGDTVMRVTPPKGRSVKLSPQTAAERKKSFNHRLIAIHGWETKPADWECTKTPEGEDVCVGRAPPPDATPYDPAPPRNDAPPENGGEEIGGDGDGNEEAAYQPVSAEIPPHLPNRKSCYMAAYNTYRIMLYQVCTIPRDPSRCQAIAFMQYKEHVEACTIAFPPG